MIGLQINSIGEVHRHGEYLPEVSLIGVLALFALVIG